ncbi:MAG TPA: TPM domain-containing protein [Candidatus Limnocylindria bacterium]|nr:TPM domain-containing protein [Candidatus Limnocylindria bacterium]
MHRWARALPSALALLALTPLLALAAGPPFPDPVDNQAVYDTAGILSPEAVQQLETTIDAIEARSGAEVVVYTQVDPFSSEDENLANARALVDQWGVGRSGFDDSLVLMIGMDEDLVHGRVSLFGGSGFLGAYADEAALKEIIEIEFVPLARAGDLQGATLATIATIDQRVTPGGRERLQAMRVVNAGLGIVVAPLALLGTMGWAWWTWRREGDDPELIDSPSILMAGPPADMTPALATVVREGRANQHTINTMLAELASSGRISFENLDRVRGMHSDDEPDPLNDPAIVVNRDGAGDPLAGPELEAWGKIRNLAGDDQRLTRQRLWRLNSTLGPVKGAVEYDAVKLGWLARMPGPSIGRMTGIGLGITVIGAGLVGLGIFVPMSGAVLLGGALVLGGIATIGFGRAMSQRTDAGAYVDAMLTAYRRTLRKTMDQARSMGEVVEQPDIAKLADTPDKAVVWGMALGLHDEVASLLARGLEEQRRATGSPAGAYYPGWIGSSPASTWSGAVDRAAVTMGSGSVFSDSAMPDIGGMFDALGSVGSSPPSSSSSSSGGGGFSGGGGGGGGGASGSF